MDEWLHINTICIKITTSGDDYNISSSFRFRFIQLKLFGWKHNEHWHWKIRCFSSANGHCKPALTHPVGLMLLNTWFNDFINQLYLIFFFCWDLISAINLSPNKGTISINAEKSAMSVRYKRTLLISGIHAPRPAAQLIWEKNLRPPVTFLS